jgi:ABC-type multidrug transport system permease subunit
MYRVSPFTYLISGMLSVGLANQSVHCSPIEVLTIQPPPNTTCSTYLSPYISFAGGAVYNPDASSDCQFCSIASTNVFLKAISAEYSEAWRNFGLLWGYIVFNVAMTVVLYWIVRVPKRWGVGALVGMVRVRGKELLERARRGGLKEKVEGGEGIF